MDEQFKIRVRIKGICLNQDNATFTPKNAVNLFIVYELVTWSWDLNSAFNLKDCLFGAVKLSKDNDPEKYSYSGYGIGLDSCSLFLVCYYFWTKQ